MKLKPLKHLLVTREKLVYWYVGDDFLESENNLIGCWCATNKKFEEYWDENFLAKRDSWSRLMEEPRKHDILYIYEITDMEEWISVLQDHQFVKFHDIRAFTHDAYCKLVYELVDRVIEY